MQYLEDIQNKTSSHIFGTENVPCVKMTYLRAMCISGRALVHFEFVLLGGDCKSANVESQSPPFVNPVCVHVMYSGL